MTVTSTAAGSGTVVAGAEFFALVYADPDLLRSEFDEIIAAEWPTEPPTSHRRGAVRGDPGPRVVLIAEPEERRGLSGARTVDDRSRQRSPPAA